MNLMQKLDQQTVEKLSANKRLDDFGPGDTVKVMVRIVEGDNERLQAYEGICIAKKSRGLQSAFTVRKISHGEGVERVFPLFSPRIDSIELVRRGTVRRAKLYYLRGLTGKAARIKEKMDYEAIAAKKEAKTNGAPKADKAPKAPKAEKAPKAKKEKKAK